MKIVPVILAGGSGTRLWPLSREAYPKQFLKLVGQHSLFQETILRARSLEKVDAIFVVGNEQHYFIYLEQLREINVSHVHFILEPFGKNTAPAIALAACYIKKWYLQTDIALLVLPSDHLITDVPSFQAAISTATGAVSKDFLITFGVQPTSAKTGYGYIEAGENIFPNIQKIKKFIEKPNHESAEKYIQQENFYWNSGIFLFRADIYLSELQQHSPKIYNAVLNTFTQSSEKKELGWRIDPTAFESCPSDSIDYAVMEKTNHSAIVPLGAAWSDLGCWTSVAEVNESDDVGNVLMGNVLVQESENCYVSSEGPLIAVMGLKNHIVVGTKDAVLVADKKHSETVKQLVNQLKEKNDDLTRFHQYVYRPWGQFEVLAKGSCFQVKRIVVKSGAKLSLQIHQKRAEHWVVVSGVADIVNGDQQFLLHANQSTYIPHNTKHRLSNTQDEPLVIIEIQTGSYLGEDDIVRLEDIYDRSPA